MPILFYSHEDSKKVREAREAKEKTRLTNLCHDLAYNPNQPRDPKGSDTGGEWTSTGSSKKAKGEIKKGSIVKFKDPESEDEKKLRMKVLEDNGDRVLVEALVDMTIKPTYVYLKKDLVLEK
jgi:hypothetical protein